MPHYIADGRFRREGAIVQPGETVEMPEEEAAILLRRFLVRVVEAPARAGYRRRDMQADAPQGDVPTPPVDPPEPKHKAR
jgi:hypothetical protein